MRPWNTCDFSLRVESGQGDRPVGGRQGVRNIASEGGYITDLRSRDQVTGFCQCLGMDANQRVQCDSVDWHAGAYIEIITSQFERVHLRDKSQINQGVDGSAAALLQIEQ